MEATLPLEGLYLHLIRSGFPLSVRDYQDALTALRHGHGLPRRADLQWLCEALWARTEPERARLNRLFQNFPQPSAEEVRRLRGEAADADAPAAARGEGGSAAAEQGGPEERPQQAPVVEFVAGNQSGVGLPRAYVAEAAGETHIFSRRPLLSLRTLVIAWRRFRLAQRSGPPVELDVDATVHEQCRRGLLVEPVLVPARVNQARLVVLVDASPSMITWRHMNRLLADSLERSQFAHSALYFFDNAPADNVFEVDALTRPLPIAAALERDRHCALAIISDAGAARGRRDRERVARTRDFLEAVKQVWYPIAWLNPMPRARWERTSAAQIARLPAARMFELDDAGLTYAIDYLRGKRDA